MTMQFWFDFASTYSYVSAMRIETLAARSGVAVEWRPFLLGPIFARQGLDTSPFNVNEAKGRNMWRDMERLCRAQGLAFTRPHPFPQFSLVAARIALAARDEPWQPAFCRGVFEAEFARGEDISVVDVLGGVLAGLGLDRRAWLRTAQDQDIKDALKAQTQEAMDLGIFGAPTFLVGDELFWGNDRLEQALEWAATKPPT